LIPPRTTPDLVKGILLQDYGQGNDLTPFIATASALVDRAAQLGEMDPADPGLELPERWLAAHFYACSDQTYAAKSTGGASGTFQGKTGMYLESTRYGQTAVSLDPTGLLGQVAGGLVDLASATYLGGW
jgi:hypothetical protein